MKGILKSIVLSLTVIVSVSGASQAVFSATSSIANNVVTVGTVSLLAHNFSGNKPIGTTATYLAPTQSTPDGRAELYNTGNLPVKLYMYVDGVTGTGCDRTWLTVKTGLAGGDEQARIITSRLIPGLTGASNRVEVTGNPPFASLGPNINQVIHQYATLDGSADNTYMGRTCNWTEYFVAESLAY